MLGFPARRERGRGRGPTHQVGVLREAPPPSWSRHTARATRVPSRIAWWMPRGATQSPIAWSVGTLPFRARYRVSVERLPIDSTTRSGEHTSELQSQAKLVCRLLREKK